MTTKREIKKASTALAFLAPNILGFLAFTLLPLLISLYMAFTNWDLRLHNMFKDNAVEFVGLENFIRLFNEPDFWKYLGNTIYLMLGIPLGIAGSLGAALLLNNDLSSRTRHNALTIAFGIMFGAGIAILIISGMGGSAMFILLVSLFGLILTGGKLGGSTFHRTLFYTPSFVSGVAIFILWKKLYNPQTGPINSALTPVLKKIEALLPSLPAGYETFCSATAFIAITCLLSWGVIRTLQNHSDAESGWITTALAITSYLATLVFIATLIENTVLLYTLPLIPAAALLYALKKFPLVRQLRQCPPTYSIGNRLMATWGICTLALVIAGIALAIQLLPTLAADGLTPPEWLADRHWAKPALMIMGLWWAIGSNNMLLYLAGLSNIPPELYEAADIDGASKWQKFAHITWPQLAPVTFFIVIMSVIGGLQGGFEMARTMTQGGPADSTTTLSYFIYREGFELGRLGYASAISWTLFLLVFVVTLFNYRFGNRYVND